VLAHGRPAPGPLAVDQRAGMQHGMAATLGPKIRIE